MSNCLVQKMNYMKSKHRSNLLLRKWSADGYWCRQNDLLKVKDPATFTDTIERISINDLTVDEFIERYEKGNRPCIITGVTDNWRGSSEWQLKVSTPLFSLKITNFHYSVLLSVLALHFSKLVKATLAASSRSP